MRAHDGERIKFASISVSLAPPPKISQRSACSQVPTNVVFELSADAGVNRVNPKLSPLDLATRRPVALLAVVPRPLVLFSAGALSGAIAKTITAPLDRVKILLQVKGALATGAIGEAAARGSLIDSLVAVGKQEGLRGYWKGNLPQVLRVVPYSAAQLYSYEVFKKWFAAEDGKLSVPRRLAAGAAAGMTATLLTHPLDTLRLRMAVDPGCKTLSGAIRVLLREGSGPAFYRGLGASMAGIAPYMALELACYDLLPANIPSFARGFSSALIATVSCYPLDTVRRRIQLQAATAMPWDVAVGALLAEEGVRGFYRGFLPNALKNLPNKGVKLSVFDQAKKLLAAGEVAYEEESAAAGAAAVALAKA